MTSVFYVYIHIYIRCFIETKQNQPIIIRTIPVLNTTLLQAFKPKLLTYDQLHWKLINKIYRVCLLKLKHFQPHSLLCQLWCLLTSVLCIMIKKVIEAASTKLFFFTIHISRAIVSSQYHPRETRPLLGEPNLHRNCYIGFVDNEMFLYYIWKWVNLFAYSFFSYSAIPFTYRHFHM
jgi:hypothetical protein